eukprot:jgi/Chrzof1/12027/Cz06g18180.t1
MSEKHQQDSDIKDARDQEPVSDVLATASAFFRWRQMKLKATFQRQLQVVLADIYSEEDNTQKLRNALHESQSREKHVTSQLVELQAEHSTAIQHDQDQHAALQHLQQALEEAQLGVAALQERATLAETAYTSEVQRSHDTQMQLKQEVQRLKQEEQADLLQQQALLDALAARDERVAELSSELTQARQQAAELQHQCARMEGIVRATGEKAAAAEEDARQQARLLAQAQDELSKLRDRYQSELSELQPLKVAAAEVVSLRGRLSAATATAASLAAACDDIRRAKDEATAQLAAAQQKCRQLQADGSIGGAIVKAVQNLQQLPGDTASVIAKLTGELDARTSELLELAPRLASCQAVIVQEEHMIKRLSAELGQAKQAADSAHDQADVQRALNIQLQVEVEQLTGSGELARDIRQQNVTNASSSHISPIPNRSKHMLLVSQLTDQASDIHTCARAMRHHKPQLSKPNHMAQAATALLKTAASSINDVTKQLRAADFAGGAMDGAAVAAALHKAVDNLQHTVSDMHQMTTNMSTGHAELDSLQGQYHSVVLAVQHAREAVLSAAAMLADATADQSAKHHSTAAHAHIGGYLQDAQHGASESGSGALSEALQQLQEAEHQLVSCIENIRAVSGGVVAGDESFIAADIAAQEVLTSLMKICALLSGPGVIEAAVAKKDVGVVRTWLAVAEGRIAEKLKVVRRFISDVCKCHHALLQYEQQIPQACIALSSTSAGSHECPHLLHSAPACVSAAYVCQPQVAYCCADVVQIVASFHTTLSSSLHAFSAVAKHLSAGHQGATKVVTLMRQLEALLSVTPQVASGSMSGNDVAALKVELAAAKHTVECQERHIQQLVARDKQLLGGTAELVPAELLIAAKQETDAIKEQGQVLQQHLQQQRAAACGAIDVFVQRVQAEKSVALLAEGFAKWRTAAAVSKVRDLQHKSI